MACPIWIVTPSKLIYASIGFEIIRIARAKTDLNNIIKRVNLLLIRMKNQGSEYTHIISLLKKILEKLIVFNNF